MVTQTIVVLSLKFCNILGIWIYLDEYDPYQDPEDRPDDNDPMADPDAPTDPDTDTDTDTDDPEPPVIRRKREDHREKRQVHVNSTT